MPTSSKIDSPTSTTASAIASTTSLVINSTTPPVTADFGSSELDSLTFTTALAIASTTSPMIASTTPPATADFDSQVLPKTLLSEHIEERLGAMLRKDRQLRANQCGKRYEQVLGAELVIIRVISSVDGTLEVTKEIRSYFSYPNEFPYKSKFLLAFQKDVPVFGMFFEEFEVDAPFPNKLTANISTLESSKLFFPDIKAADGSHLRTLTFYEILLGYLEFIQSRGFKSCFLYAAPPPYGRFYIFYKCPASLPHTMESLRKWYFDMLKKGKEEGVVKDFKSIVDFLFYPTSKITFRAARLPYDKYPPLLQSCKSPES